jgi:hypothetical protein
MNEIILNSNTRDGLVQVLQETGGLRPTQMLRVGAARLGRVVGRE